jgi:hypothetical protein
MSQGLAPPPAGAAAGTSVPEGKLMPVDSLQKQDGGSYDGRCGALTGRRWGRRRRLRSITKDEGLQACAVADAAATGPDQRHNLRGRTRC